MPAGAGLLRLDLLGTVLLPIPWGPSFLLALASEAIDRAAFYASLEPSTPVSRMRTEMQEALARD